MVIRIKVGKRSPEYKSMQGRVFLIESVDDVPYDALHELGVRRLLFDYDGTLVRDWRADPDDEMMRLLDELSERFEVMVFSNHWILRSKRRKFLREHGIKYVRTQKPFVFEYAVLEEPKMTVLIGDKLFTDGLYGILRHIPVYLLKRNIFKLW